MINNKLIYWIFLNFNMSYYQELHVGLGVFCARVQTKLGRLAVSWCFIPGRVAPRVPAPPAATTATALRKQWSAASRRCGADSSSGRHPPATTSHSLPEHFNSCARATLYTIMLVSPLSLRPSHFFSKSNSSNISAQAASNKNPTKGYGHWGAS